MPLFDPTTGRAFGVPNIEATVYDARGEVVLSPRPLREVPRRDRPQAVQIVQSEFREIVRSFSYKHSIKDAKGEKTFESADFFCSQKAQCLPDEAEEYSRDLFEFCMEEVTESLRLFKSRMAAKHAAREAGRNQGRNAA